MAQSNGCNEELWSIFHNELDLDSNGHLDAEELTVALRKAGERNPLLILASIRMCRRGTSVSVDAIQLYDLPHRISPRTLNKLSRVPRFSTTSSPKGVNEGNIPVL